MEGTQNKISIDIIRVLTKENQKQDKYLKV